MDVNRDKIIREIRRWRGLLKSVDMSLSRLAPILSAAVSNGEARRSAPARRRPRLSAKARASMVLQGRYMGYMRQLKPRQKVLVREIRDTKGVRAAIAKARGMASA